MTGAAALLLAAAALVACVAPARGADPAPRAVVLVRPGPWPADVGRMTEALQVYLRDFGAAVRATSADPLPEVGAIAARGDAEFAAVMTVDARGTRLHVQIIDLRGGETRRRDSEADVPAGVKDPARHVALLVRAELTAAARVPPPPARVVAAPAAVSVATTPELGLASGAGAFGAAAPGGSVELGVSLSVGYGGDGRFAGALLEAGREGSRVEGLGRGEITRLGVGLDLRPGRLISGPRWALLWGGQVGGNWTRTVLVGDERRHLLADTYAPFVRAGVWSWHRIARRVVLTWEAAVEILPLATEVKAGPERVFASGHARSRVAMGVLVHQ